MFDKVMSELASYTGNVSDQGLTIAKKVRLCRPAVPSTLFVLMQLDRARWLDFDAGQTLVHEGDPVDTVSVPRRLARPCEKQPQRRRGLPEGAKPGDGRSNSFWAHAV